MDMYYLLRDNATQAMTDEYNGSSHFLADISIFIILVLALMDD